MDYIEGLSESNAKRLDSYNSSSDSNSSSISSISSSESDSDYKMGKGPNELEADADSLSRHSALSSHNQLDSDFPRSVLHLFDY